MLEARLTDSQLQQDIIADSSSIAASMLRISARGVSIEDVATNPREAAPAESTNPDYQL
jgi:hypothetical protein